jgi:hypothetical protein
MKFTQRFSVKITPEIGAIYPKPGQALLYSTLDQ